MVVPLTTEALWYNWSLVVTEVDTEKLSQSSQRQRKNLLVWLGAREVLRLARQANLHFLPINTSLLMPNINYRIEVAARNLLGVVGPSVGLDLQLVENSKDPYIGLIILSPKSTPASQPLPLEARVTSGCGVVCLDNFKYQWEVTKNNRTTALYSSWFKVTVPGHLLQDTGLYNITCIMSNNSITLAQADVQVLVEPAKIVLTVIPKNLILGTGQTLNLDVSNSLQNTNISSFQIFWRCMTVDGQECVAPGSKQLVSTIFSSALSNPKLKLPPGSLSVGRYKWTVAVVSVQEEDVVAVSSADVEVMPGHPPVLTVGPPSITSRTSLSYLTVSGSAAEVRPGCKLQWTSLPSLGCNLLPFGNASGSSKELTSGTRGDLTLMLPARLLQPGAQYCLRFSTFCSAAEYAHADVLVQLDSIPNIEVLEVSPAQGEALITLFNFSTKRTTKFGSVYSFGYYPPTGSPVYVYSSAYFLSTKTILPVFSNGGSQVKTLLRVCSAQKVCSFRDGPLINTALPTSLTPQQVRYLSRLTSSLIASGDPLEAMTLATSIISTTKMLKDQSSNQLLTSSITEAILERINLTSQRLDKDPSSRLDAILFLDSVTRVLPQLQLNDSSLTIVVAFRDKLASTPASKPNPSGRLQSQLVMEPRVVREKRQQSIPTDIPPETPNTVEIWLRTSEAAILSFSPSKSLEEKQKLLTNLDGYIAGLCQWLPDSRPIYLGSRVVNLSVQKLSTADNGQKVNIPNCPDKCDILPAKVHLGKEFISKFMRVNLDPICLTGFHFPFGSLDTVFKTSPGFIQLSSVYRLKILTYSLSNVFKEAPSPTLKLGFPLESPLPSPQHVIKCCIVVSNTWTADRCEMVQVNESAVTCRCPPYEYYRIAERFSKVVGENSTEFSNLIKNQLIEQLSLPKDSILDIYVTDGSILVTMALRNTQQMSAEECMMELAQALDVGQLNLRTADNQPLDVPRQPLQVLKKTTGEKSGLSAVFLASVSLGLCGLVAVYVTLVTIVTKHSRKKEALRAVQRKAADKVSRYSSLPLPHSLDGSSIRYGTWSGDDLDSGIYDSDAGKRSGAGMVPKHKDFQSTNL
ncbi:uncharacterized protein LOC128998384 isoform X2 [Macrosteles quadrilineatus]|uniref:uncharacterized protein LOC128998384 isoform X2 n=1 Tax=Macrosteles quadrilineatus TaxID=74068 RepID=UPI0023E13E8C|nr:uncharacterized protein LOC128998384 isoform X2 [Macrosteles quadrilineatus]